MRFPNSGSPKREHIQLKDMHSFIWYKAIHIIVYKDHVDFIRLVNIWKKKL